MTRLEQLRIDRLLSRRELAKETGVSVGTIRRIEEQEGGIQIATLRKLVDFFEVSATEMLGDAIHVPSAHEAEAA
jgi:transcriptional regulator with XRE-family HTH domain